MKFLAAAAKEGVGVARGAKWRFDGSEDAGGSGGSSMGGWKREVCGVAGGLCGVGYGLCGMRLGLYWLHWLIH